MKNIKLFFVFLFIYHLTPTLGFAGPYRAQAEKINIQAWQFSSELSMFSTTGYYDEEGEFEAMNEEDEFQKIDVDLGVRYGYGHQLELRAGLRLRQLTSTSIDTELTSSGAESFTLGAKYTLFPRSKSPWKFALDTYFRNSFYTNESFENGNPPSDDLVLGDSGTSFLVGGHASYHANSKNFIVSTSGFFHRAPNNLSNEVIYSAEVMVPFTKLALGGGIEGIYSLEGDEFSEVPEQKPAQATGVTRLFNSVNRSRMLAYAKGVYRSNQWSLYAKAGIVNSGTSTDEGNLLAAGLTWDIGGVDPKRARVERFKEYNIEASILQVSPRGKFVKIDKGLAQDVSKGQRFDIYETDYFGGNKLMATGIVFEVSADEAIIRLDRMIANGKVEAGFTARAQ